MFFSLRQIGKDIPQFVAILGLCRIIMDKNRTLFADLSIKWLFVHTTQNERMKKVWKQTKNARIFASSKVENGRNKLQTTTATE
jgi:hypothetical protein